MQDAEKDPKYLEDLVTLTQEVHWQIQGQIHETDRRWPELLLQDAQGQAALLINWIKKATSLAEMEELLLDTDFKTSLDGDDLADV